MTPSYLSMRRHALNLGFTPVEAARAYKGCYYIKDGKKFVFDSPALKGEMDVSTDAELIAMGYDTNTYSEIQASEELSEILADCEMDETGAIYVSDGNYLARDSESGLLRFR